MSTFDNIKHYADLQKISLQDVAIKAGLSDNAIYRYNQGVEPKYRTLKAIADVLNIDVGELNPEYANKDESNDSEDKKYVDLSGTNIFTYQGKPIPEDDWEIIKQLLDRAANRGKNDDSGDK